MVDINSMREKFRIQDIIKYFKFKYDFKRNNPTYFDPDGLIIFTGAQGTGKTLSAVNYGVDIIK